MKKLFCLLALMLLLPIEAQASEPQAFNFDMNMEIRLDIPSGSDMEMVFLLLGGLPLQIEAAGTVVMENELAPTMFFQSNMPIGFLSAPFRFWVDLDLNNMEDPTAIAIFELPEIMRALMANASPTLSRRFMYMDFSNIIENADISLISDNNDIPESMNFCFDFIVGEGDNTSGFGISYNMTITQQSHVTRIPMPALTLENSINLMEVTQ